MISGKDIDTVRTAIDTILDDVDMDQAFSDPITKFWIQRK